MTKQQQQQQNKQKKPVIQIDKDDIINKTRQQLKKESNPILAKWVTHRQENNNTKEVLALL